MHDLEDVEKAFQQFFENNTLIFYKEGCKTDVIIPRVYIAQLVSKISKILDIDIKITPPDTPLKRKEVIALYYQEYLNTQDYAV